MNMSIGTFLVNTAPTFKYLTGTYLFRSNYNFHDNYHRRVFRHFNFKSRFFKKYCFKCHEYISNHSEIGASCFFNSFYGNRFETHDCNLNHLCSVVRYPQILNIGGIRRTVTAMTIGIATIAAVGSCCAIGLSLLISSSLILRDSFNTTSSQSSYEIQKDQILIIFFILFIMLFLIIKNTYSAALYLQRACPAHCLPTTIFRQYT